MKLDKQKINKFISENVGKIKVDENKLTLNTYIKFLQDEADTYKERLEENIRETQDYMITIVKLVHIIQNLTNDELEKQRLENVKQNIIEKVMVIQANTTIKQKDNK